MSRYEVQNGHIKWIFGWDQPLMSFFLQLHNLDLPEEERIISWAGSTVNDRLYEVEELVQMANQHGLDIDSQTQAALYLDKDEGR